MQGARQTIWGRVSALRKRGVLITIAVLAIIFLLIGLSISFPIVQKLDLHVTREVQESNGTPLDQVMYFGTFVGGSPVICTLAVALSVLLFLRRLRKMALFVLATLISLPIDMLLKHLWGRDRPNPLAVNVLLPTSGSSFPSGHVLGTTAFYGFLAVLAWIHLPKRRARFVISALLAAMIPYVALSRVYVGAHWFSDVIGALTIGLILLVAMVTLYQAAPKEAQHAAKTVADLSSDNS